ncbi:GyrI-like domain-containing protein [Fimbriimonas ginsengisoli]|uniref:Transcriptional activator ligand binding domain protein n=1 Tax=Fimbriimonas ginsengisoli Gsoil 348 TaxID=661478 RepID=A0A068NM08_FIMGI|nr:GyrI-like domain-containing protein [Fimbriimonas ginsengisoli]AIE84563.1 transcriptional activator ligand binding domain protein [Fimbriimonas ginsengisoli Gsoil 348]
MLDTPEIAQTDSLTTATIRLTIPRHEIQQVMGPAIQEVMAAVAAQGLTPTGPVFSYHYKMDPGTFDFEVGIPVASPPTPVGRVQASQLPARKVARTTYRGPYEGLGEGWGKFADWIEGQGLATAPDLWEFYAAGPESGDDSSTWRTELVKPLVDQ